MQTEFEVKLIDIDCAECKTQLLKFGGQCVQERTFMKRMVFDHPDGGTRYLRIRDEGDCITCTVKEISGGGIEMVQELETTVGSFTIMQQIIERLGIPAKSYQETYREVWQCGSVQIMIDERPGLAPFVEIEGPDEQSVRDFVSRLGYAWDVVVFGAVDEIYHRVYGVPHEIINAKPSYRFDEPIVF